MTQPVKGLTLANVATLFNYFPDNIFVVDGDKKKVKVYSSFGNFLYDAALI